MSDALIPLGASCAYCYYFFDRSDDADAIVRGECRRHAPTATGWPTVTEHCWCGDWTSDYRPVLRKPHD
jgi:hypothetical protein